MKTRQYPIICPSCGGSGLIPTQGTSADVTQMCPACKGEKTVICTETIDDWLEQIKKIIPRNPL
jgi:DnaJ-class molecular chaperone